MASGMEMERKFLLRMPDEALLRSMPGCEIWEICQIYLTSGTDGCTRRLRRVRTAGEERFIRTEKRRVSDISCHEREEEISAEVYEQLLRERDPALRPIEKTRYRIPYAGQLLEIDVYSFWRDRATLEIELEREDQPLRLPQWLDVLREVTGEAAYRNVQLARALPEEEIGRWS